MRRISTALALALAATTLAACGSDSEGTTPGGDSSNGASGSPAKGGHLNVMQISEPRTFDPGVLGNTWSTGGLVGNAVFGTLMVDSDEPGKYEPVMAESFETSDDGATFTLTLRDGLVFSDGTPLEAEDVKYNWDRLKDPLIGGAAAQNANMVAETSAPDARTLSIKLVEPIPNFGEAVVTGPMNWIAKPESLEDKSGDSKPVGAGPYLLKSWARQNSMELERNEKYYDPELPYIDTLSVRSSNDSNQRLNTLKSGGVDIMSETSWDTVAMGRDAGLNAETVDLNGGQYVAMNSTKPPFDDIRVRQAVIAAIDPELINSAAYNGNAKLPTTLFQESSPFYNSEPLMKQDKELAQKLFDEATADGVDISFTFKTFPTVENKAVAESIQAQLRAFKNVKAEVQTIDFAETAAVYGTKDFEMIVTSSTFVDPEPALINSFTSTSRSNASGINDPELDAALQESRAATTLDGRKAAYLKVEQRIRDLAPGVWYTRAAPSAIWGDTVDGVDMYGLGSIRPELLWKTK